MCEKNEAIEVLEDRYNELTDMETYATEAKEEIEEFEGETSNKSKLMEKEK